MALIAYVDESGDPGLTGSRTYVLACVFLDLDHWPEAFDRMISFRRWLRVRFGIPIRAEIKANYLLRNAGPFRTLGLSERARKAIYRQHLRLHGKIGLNTFAVLIRKPELEIKLPGANPRDTAWDYMLQRLERLTTKSNQTLVLTHDEGENAIIRRLARKARRAGTAGSAFGTGQLTVPFRLLADDPVPKQSVQSYFLQMADLAAFAAYRHLYASPHPKPMVAASFWDQIGEAALFTPVNSVRGGPTAIVAWPDAGI